MTLKSSDFLDQQRTKQDFIVCHLNGKYIVTVIKCCNIAIS